VKLDNDLIKMTDLQILETIEKLERQEEMDKEEEQEVVNNQIFPAHETLNDRFCKTLYYGRLPSTDRTSLPLTQLAVDRFTGVGLDALGEKLGRLDMSRASDISRNACASPTSLVLALLYLDRLRRNNPDYLNTITSTDLFLVSLLVANKFLHDDGEEDEVFNDEWASSGGLDTKELNRLELGFLSAMDWRIYVDNNEFRAAVERVETDIAFNQVSSRGWASYTDLVQLTNTDTLHKVWCLLSECSIKATAVCLTAYAASILTILGTVSVLSNTPFGPAQVTASVRTLADSCLSSTEGNKDDSSPGKSSLPDASQTRIPDIPDILIDIPDILTDSEPLLDNLHDVRPSAAEFLTASLIVATLTSSTVDTESEQSSGRGRSPRRNGSSGVDKEKGMTIDEDHRRANWLAEYSAGDTQTDEVLGNNTDWGRTPPDLNNDGSVAGNNRPREPWLRWQEEFIRHATTADITDSLMTGGHSEDSFMEDRNRALRKFRTRDDISDADGILERLADHWEKTVQKELRLSGIEGVSCPVLKWNSHCPVLKWCFHCPVLKWGAHWLGQSKSIVSVTS